MYMNVECLYICINVCFARMNVYTKHVYIINLYVCSTICMNEGKYIMCMYVYD